MLTIRYIISCMLVALGCHVYADDAFTVHKESFLQQLRHDLSALDKDSRITIVATVNKALTTQAMSLEKANEITRSIIIEEGKKQQRIIAENFYTTADRVNRVVASQQGNILAILSKTTNINGAALAPYFGDNLLEKTQKDALHPDNKQHLKPEWYHLLSDTNTPSYESLNYKPFDFFRRREMYNNFDAQLREMGLRKPARDLIKNQLWNKCQLCHTESEIRACMKVEAERILRDKIHAAVAKA